MLSSFKLSESFLKQILVHNTINVSLLYIPLRRSRLNRNLNVLFQMNLRGRPYIQHPIYDTLYTTSNIQHPIYNNIYTTPYIQHHIYITLYTTPYIQHHIYNTLYTFSPNSTYLALQSPRLHHRINQKCHNPAILKSNRPL